MKYWILIGLLLPSTVLALTYEEENLPYNDLPSDRATKIAISVLTDEGILRGNPDGTIKADVPINRAEFMKIAMSLLPPETRSSSSRCFADVDPNIWFARHVCRAKRLGIVSGNALVGVDPDFWPFEAVRSVKYEEALKVLFRIYGTPLLTVDGEWYEKYLRSAKHHSLALDNSAPGSGLTRGQVARLVVAFMANNIGELEELRYAETHPPIPVRTVFEAPEPQPPSSSSASSQVSSLSSSSVQFDELIEDTSTDDAVLVLGKVTHILGAAELFANSEPIIVHDFLIDIVAANSSLDAMHVYDHHGKLIGRATVDPSVPGKTRYRLGAKTKDIVLPYRDEYTYYVRGVLRNQESGGSSGGSVQVDSMGIAGVGKWSSRDYEQFTVGETFSESTVARSSITEIRNVGDDRGILIEGTDQEIGAFFFKGVTGHSAARLKITAIDFQIGSVGGTTISNVTMKVDGSNERLDCTVSSSTLTCSGLSDTFGRIDDSSRVLRLYADIDVPDSSQSAGLQLSINDPGTIGSAGDITWTDGVTTFTWVDFPRKPVARGTYYSY